ncbi:MAG: cell division protein FtsA, partial [Synergistales bacterium]|nr:cell division protein FtsA [Synergistales bacterium]
MYKEPEILVGLDLGTSKIAVVVAERDSRFQEAQIIGVGYAPSQGIRKGLIINLEQAVRSVRHAVKDAENMVGFEISEATVSFSGIDVASVTSRGMISLGRTPRQVSISDVERVIEAAQSELSIPSNRVTLHTIPVKYSIDGNSGIDDPLGMTGIRLEMELQSVIIPTTVVQNIINCVETAGVEVNGLVIKSLASA